MQPTNNNPVAQASYAIPPQKATKEERNLLIKAIVFFALGFFMLGVTAAAIGRPPPLSGLFFGTSLLTAFGSFAFSGYLLTRMLDIQKTRFQSPMTSYEPTSLIEKIEESVKETTYGRPIVKPCPLYETCQGTYYGGTSMVSLFKSEYETYINKAARSNEYFNRIHNEYAVGCRLIGYKHVMQINDRCEPSLDRPYLYAKYIQGNVLANRLSYPMGFDEARQIVIQMLDLAIYMIGEGVLPRDLTNMRNFMLDEEGNLKLVDLKSCLIYRDEENNFGDVCKWGQTESKCIFRDSFGDILAFSIALLKPHKEVIQETDFGQTLYDPTIWDISENKTLFISKFPGTQGDFVSLTSEPSKKVDYLVYCLENLRKQLYATFSLEISFGN